MLVIVFLSIKKWLVLLLVVLLALAVSAAASV